MEDAKSLLLQIEEIVFGMFWSSLCSSFSSVSVVFKATDSHIVFASQGNVLIFFIRTQGLFVRIIKELSWSQKANKFLISPFLQFNALQQKAICKFKKLNWSCQYCQGSFSYLNYLFCAEWTIFGMTGSIFATWLTSWPRVVVHF